MPTPKFFYQLLIYVNLCQHVKIRLFHWFVLEIWLIKKSCNLIGWEHFGPYLRNQNFPTYEICPGWNTANIINFQYRTNSVKINDTIFQYILKTLLLAHFWLTFPIFWRKKNFPRKSGSVTHNSIWASSIMLKFRRK